MLYKLHACLVATSYEASLCTVHVNSTLAVYISAKTYVSSSSLPPLASRSSPSESPGRCRRSALWRSAVAGPIQHFRRGSSSRRHCRLPCCRTNRRRRRRRLACIGCVPVWKRDSTMDRETGVSDLPCYNKYGIQL